jgi:hypothetical protein
MESKREQDVKVVTVLHVLSVFVTLEPADLQIREQVLS